MSANSENVAMLLDILAICIVVVAVVGGGATLVYSIVTNPELRPVAASVLGFLTVTWALFRLTRLPE